MKNLVNLKHSTFILVVILSIEVSAQTKSPFYQQLAFNFYQNKILDSFPVNKRITIYKYVYHLNKEAYIYAS